MAKQSDLAQQLNDLVTQLSKVNTEITGKISDLEAELANQDNVSPGLQAAFDALKPSVQALDDIVPDVPTA